ncbi:MAG: VTT domain-containing protein [Candidatus Sericytochromatia bacterium]|nr:VTT domain-containing protein [Candidatus Sericytochromatia bacterium]
MSNLLKAKVGLKHKTIIYIWITLVILGILFYLSYPTSFSPINISNFLKRFDSYMIVIYIILCMLRGFTLIPGTPFVVAGAILFPTHPFLMLFISVSCMLFSSIILYFFSEFLGFDNFFKNKYPEKIEVIKNKLDGVKGVFFIALWAAFPLAPTDLVCYVAGVIRLNLKILLLGIFFGELPICAFYIFTYKLITL